MNLMWFRTDLRLHDNTALHFAQKNSDFIALFIISPKQWKFHDDADCKVDFWLRQLQQLCQDLDDLNIPLLIRTCELWEDCTDTIFELVARNAEKHSDEIAIIGLSQQPITYVMLEKQILETITALQRHGIGSGDCIALVLPNGPMLAMAFIAIASFGFVYGL